MRRLLFVALVAAAGCKAPPPPPAPVAPPPPRPLESMLDVANPDIAAQLVTGFHQIEWGNGRWTKQSFSVLLKAPRTARDRGATLRIKADLPPSLIDQLQSVTLTCSAGGPPLPPETFTTHGPQLLSRPLPSLAADRVTVTCKLDKKYAAAGDSRDLGLVLHVIGLEPN